MALPLNAPTRATPYFAVTSTPRIGTKGTVALMIRAGQSVDMGRVGDDLQESGRQVVAIIDLAGEWLEPDAFGVAREQLRTTLREISAANHGCLAVLLAGPTCLSWLAGVMAVENTHKRVLVYEHSHDEGGGRYDLAYGLPRATGVPGPHTLLCLESTPVNPKKEEVMRPNVELRAISEAIRLAGVHETGTHARTRFDVKTELAMRITDLGDGLLRHRPRILHISSHGVDDAVVAQDELGLAHYLPMSHFVEIVTTVGDTIELVVLSMCNSRRGADQLAERGKVAIGFEGEADDLALVPFSRSLYMTLANGGSVAAAFRAAAVGYSGAKSGVPHLAVPPGENAEHLSFAPAP